MTTLTIIDCEATAKTWAESNAAVIAQVADRVFYATPKAYEKTPPFAWLVLKLIAESHEPDDLGMQRALIQFDAWGRTKLQAANAVIAVQTAARQLYNGPPLTVGQTVIAVGNVSQKRWLPDPTTNTPRYSLDVFFSMRGPEA